MLKVKDKLGDFLLPFAFALRFHRSLLVTCFFLTLGASVGVDAEAIAGKAYIGAVMSGTQSFECKAKGSSEGSQMRVAGGVVGQPVKARLSPGT